MNLLKAYNLIKENLELINSINIFPVYDKDTGSNVLYTLESIKDIEITKDNLSDIANKAIFSARGNSGNILSLFLIGLAENKDKSLYDMCKDASDFVWNNMYNPKHGTMLDALSSVPKAFEDLETFILYYYNNILSELFYGKQKLNVLYENDTVDAGTLCLTYIFKGLYESLSNKVIEFNIKLNPIDKEIDKNKYKYCINFNIENISCPMPKDIEYDEYIKTSFNNSCRIHLHTNDYNSILQFYSKFGEINNVYIQDMEKEEG